MWFCTDSLNCDYLYVTVIHLYMGFLIENASMSQLSGVWKYVPKAFPQLSIETCSASPHNTALCSACILGGANGASTLLWE